MKPGGYRLQECSVELAPPGHGECGRPRRRVARTPVDVPRSPVRWVDFRRPLGSTASVAFSNQSHKRCSAWRLQLVGSCLARVGALDRWSAPRIGLGRLPSRLPWTRGRSPPRRHGSCNTPGPSLGPPRIVSSGRCRVKTSDRTSLASIDEGHRQSALGRSFPDSPPVASTGPRPQRAPCGSARAATDPPP